MRRFALIAGSAATVIATAAAATAPQFDTPAKYAYLIDLSSGATLYQKNADVRMPPASMARNGVDGAPATATSAENIAWSIQTPDKGNELR